MRVFLTLIDIWKKEDFYIKIEYNELSERTIRMGVLKQENYVGRYWSKQSDGRILCELCPRYCTLKEGQRGFCFVRQNIGDEMVLTTYGRLHHRKSKTGIL